MNKDELAVLVKKAQKGEKTAFGQIYEQTGKSVYFNCLKLVGNEHTAQDILQSTYLKAFEKLNTLACPENFLAWINRIAINDCKAHFEKYSKTEQLEDDFAENIADEGFIPEDFVDNDAKRKIIMEIIDTALTPAQRQTVILYYYNNMSVSVIANIMDCPEGTVLSRLNNARIKLREAVLIYEKENNDKLHMAAPIGILGQIFKAEEQKLTLPKMSFAEFAGANVPKTNQININNNAAKAVKAGGKKMLGTLKGKIIAGISALVIVGGAITAGIIISSDDDSDRRRDDDDDKKISAEIDEDDEDNSDASDDEDDKDKDESEYDGDESSDNEDKDDSSEDSDESDYDDNDDEDEETSERDDDGSSEKTELEYPEFEGLEVFELVTYTEERDGSDEISGTIVDAYNLVGSTDNSFVLLDNEGNIYYYYAASTNPISYNVRCIAENTSITKFDDIAFDYNQNYFVALDGRTFYAKEIDDGSLWSDEEPNVTFEGEGILYEDVEDLEIIRISQSGFDLYAMDSSGFWHAAHAYYDTKYPNPVDGGLGFYHNALDTFANLEYYGIEVVDMVDTSFALSDKGQFHEIHNAAEESPIEGSENYVFVDAFENCTYFYYVSALGLTDDNKIVAMNEDGTVIFEEECPEGTLENVWMSSTMMTVKTDTGYYTATIASRWDDENIDTTFHPCDALNNVSDRIVRITNSKNVLLSNGYLYDYGTESD